jgi:hypothetical protein
MTTTPQADWRDLNSATPRQRAPHDEHPLGGQDNIQAVAGQMLMFFGELGFDFPQFPFIAHSRGWDAEDMERNVTFVQHSAALKEGTKALAERALEKAGALVGAAPVTKIERAGREAHRMEEVLLGFGKESADLALKFR